MLSKAFAITSPPTTKGTCPIEGYQSARPDKRIESTIIALRRRNSPGVMNDKTEREHSPKRTICHVLTMMSHSMMFAIKRDRIRNVYIATCDRTNVEVRQGPDRRQAFARRGGGGGGGVGGEAHLRDWYILPSPLNSETITLSCRVEVHLSPRVGQPTLGGDIRKIITRGERKRSCCVVGSDKAKISLVIPPPQDRHYIEAFHP